MPVHSHGCQSAPLWVEFNHVAIYVMWRAQMEGRWVYYVWGWGGGVCPHVDPRPCTSFPLQALSAKDQLRSVGSINCSVAAGGSITQEVKNTPLLIISVRLPQLSGPMRGWPAGPAGRRGQGVEPNAILRPLDPGGSTKGLSFSITRVGPLMKSVIWLRSMFARCGPWHKCVNDAGLDFIMWSWCSWDGGVDADSRLKCNSHISWQWRKTCDEWFSSYLTPLKGQICSIAYRPIWYSLSPLATNIHSVGDQVRFFFYH